MKPIIRKAKISDINQLINLQRLLIKFESKINKHTRKGILYYTKKELSSAIKSKNATVYVIEDISIKDKSTKNQSKIIASGLSRIIKSDPWDKYDKKGYLGMMFVLPEYRKQGLGNKIIKALLSWLKEKKIKEVHLCVYPENKGAVALYK